ncbi:hypothetical protein TorRG33x02_352550 [Trema orientale]|uniref:Tyrosine-protein kinase n=1 Tax=Trema orientale TaxID=63057 RepID=A0A2P5AE88_TREOI|nr:hypothetical protein TorRG33x02_352550 [Trema orientale]
MVEKEQLTETVGPKILEEEGGVNEDKELQLQAFLKLVSNCFKTERTDRPLMIDVAKELAKMVKSTK